MSIRSTLARVLAGAAASFAGIAMAAPPEAPSIDVELAPHAMVQGTLAGRAAEFRYEAPAGSTVTFSLRSTPAGAIDFDVRLFDPDGGELSLAGAPRFVDRPGFASLKSYVLSAAGTYTLRVGGTGDGAYRLDFAASPGSRRLRSSDVRCTTLGRPAGLESAHGLLARPGAATRLSIAATGNDLDGASADIPADAAPAGAPLLLTAAPAPAPHVLPSHIAVGAAAALVPDGLGVAGGVTLTLPYDRLRLPAGTTPAQDLRVAALDRRDRVTLLTPTSVDEEAATATVVVDSSSRWVVVAPKGPPDPAAVEYWHGSLTLGLSPHPSGNDSRGRDVNLDTGRAMFAADGSLPVTGDSHSISWWHEDDGSGHIDETTDVAQSGTIAWSFLPDGRRIQVTDPEGGGSVLEPSEDGTAYVGQIADDTTSPRCAVELVLRRTARSPTIASLAGTFWVGTMEADADQGGTSSVSIRVTRSFGTVALRPDGTWSARGATRAAWPDTARERVVFGSEPWRGDGTWSVAGAEAGWREGSVELRDTGKPGDPPLRVFPSANGLMFFGTNDPSSSGHCAFFVGVRQSAALARKTVTGSFASTELGAALQTYRPEVLTPPSPVLGDFRCWQMESRMTFDGSARLALPVEIEKEADRDPSAPGGVRVTYGSETPGGPIGFTLAGNGKIVVRAGPREDVTGAISPDARFGFVSIAPLAKDGAFGLRVFVKSPPGD